MKVRVALEFTFNYYKVDPEKVRKAITEQMEIADVYFTVERPEGEDDTGINVLELSPSRIEVISSAVEK